MQCSEALPLGLHLLQPYATCRCGCIAQARVFQVLQLKIVVALLVVGAVACSLLCQAA
jgi:hypothetical protein